MTALLSMLRRVSFSNRRSSRVLILASSASWEILESPRSMETVSRVHGLHTPVSRRRDHEEQRQYDPESESETFCNRRLLQHTIIPFTINFQSAEAPNLFYLQ